TTAPDPPPMPSETKSEVPTPVPVQSQTAHDTSRADPHGTTQHAAALQGSVAPTPTEAQEPAPPPTEPSPRPPFFQIRIFLGRHWLSVTLGVIATLVLAPLSYDSWRYWNIPWLAPNPIHDTIVWLKGPLPSQE